MEELHIAVSTNERYVPGAVQALAGVAVYSNPATALCFHVFTENVSDASYDFICKTLERLHPNSKTIHHVCEEKTLEGLPFWFESRMAAVRCLYPELMPDVDWCLYLDCDILYTSPVEELFSYRDDSMYACAVLDECEEMRRNAVRWIVENTGVEIQQSAYFNSGVMLLNLKKMREDEISSKLIKFLKGYKNIPFPDQDALNVVLGENTKLVPAKFNRLQIYLNDEKMKERPVIHYVNGNPWLLIMREVENGRFKLWHSFADKYIWRQKGMSYKKYFSLKNILYKRYLYVFLKIPLLHYLCCFSLRLLGARFATKKWRDSQILHDISLSRKDDII